MVDKKVKIKVETGFILKPKQKIDFEEDNISFIVENKGEKDKEVNIKIR